MVDTKQGYQQKFVKKPEEKIRKIRQKTSIFYASLAFNAYIKKMVTSNSNLPL